MYILIIPKLKIIIGFSPKCGCTTVQTLLMRKLNHKITSNIHRMLGPINTKTGVYDIYDLINYSKQYKIDYDQYIKIAIIRNPYSRFISGVRQRSNFIYTKQGINYNISSYLDYIKNNKFGIDIHHFAPQTTSLYQNIDIFNFPFDKVIDLSEIKILYDILGLEYKYERIGGHVTNYLQNDEKYYNYTFEEFIQKTQYNNDIKNWLTEENIKCINDLYKADFEFAKKYSIQYEIK